MIVREGGCLCGVLRFRTTRDARRTVVWPVFGESDVAITFDETGWITVDRHVWTRSKQHWFSIPPGPPAYEKSART